MVETSYPVIRRLSEVYCTLGNEDPDGQNQCVLGHVHNRVNIPIPTATDDNKPGSVSVITVRPSKPLLHATTMIRAPQLDTSTQFEEGPSRLVHGELQFQSHQEHVQPLPPFLMPKLDVKIKPRIPPQAPHLAQTSSVRIPVTSSDGLAKGTIDPLDDPRYLAAPIDILCDSIKAPRLFSPHDIAEAYCTLSTKARHGIATTKDVSAVDRIFAALEHVKAQASIVCAALQRDIRLAFVDPFLEVQPRNVSSATSGSLPPSNTPSGASFVGRKLTVHEEKKGKDHSLVCIRALQFLSIVFHVGPFQRIFSCAFISSLLVLRPITDLTCLSTAEQLLLLLGDTLKITFASKLPSLSAYKIRLLCLWTLQSQFLPREVFAPKASEILRSLMKCMEKSSDPNFKVECLKVSIKSRTYTSDFSQLSVRLPQSLLISTPSVSFRLLRNLSPQFCNISSTASRRKFGMSLPRFFAPWPKARPVGISHPPSADPCQRRLWRSSTRTPWEHQRLPMSPQRNLVR